MKILVIDDTEINLRSARESLVGHEVTTCSTADEALELLSKEKFDYDAVLSDLLMPGPTRIQADKEKFAGQEMPVGWAFVLQAALRGAKYVAVVCATDHHNHPAGTLLDDLGDYHPAKAGQMKPRFIINGAVAGFYHAPWERYWLEGGVCANCTGKGRYMHECYKCSGSGCETKWNGHRSVPIEGTVCDGCKGAKQVEGDCGYCQTSGKAESGKNWATVLAALTGADGSTKYSDYR